MKITHISHLVDELPDKDKPARIVLLDKACRKHSEDKTCICLCYLPGNLQPWVTWAHNSNINETYWGHYFDKQDGHLAVQDFLNRLEQGH